MNFPNKDEFASRELSIEELDAIAAASLWGWVKHEASATVNWVEDQGKMIGSFLGNFIGGVGSFNATHANHNVPRKVS